MAPYPESTRLLRLFLPLCRSGNFPSLLFTLRTPRLQGSLHRFRAFRPQALVHGRLWARAVSDRGYRRRAVMFKSYYIPLW